MTFSPHDLSGLWHHSEYSASDYELRTPSQQIVAEVGLSLGVKLPASYVELAGYQNGGVLRRTVFYPSRPQRVRSRFDIEGIFAIGADRPCSLCGPHGSRFWEEHWGYPRIGIYFGSCPSAGHELIALDYRRCGPEGEPAVVHVDQECDYVMNDLAPDFETFIKGLRTA